ncbi:MAG: Cysteine proteinase [Pedosphaera sp.]|nr:Cysteine proteinase [Pedosphaera sp.]
MTRRKLDPKGEYCKKWGMFKFPVAAMVLSLGVVLASAKDYTVHTFKKIQLTDQFWSEGATFGDFNHDGKMDIASGPYWYEGPDFKKQHEYYPANKSFTRKKSDGTEEKIAGFEGGLGVNNTYSDNFFAFTYDFNHDGWDDILIYGFPGLDASWYENPKGREGHWQRHVALDVVDNESPTFLDVNGDGKPDIACNSRGFYGYATADWAHPEKPWTFHPISPNKNYHKFTHGIGVGDVNGDKRMDILEKDGWWEQPESLENDPVWKFHAFPFAAGHGSSQMYAYDVNGDGKNDVITALNAHGFGLAWYEQINDNGQISFKKHIILNEQIGKDKPAPNDYGVIFSQLHSVDLIDMDGDGIKDIVTGKRFWAHGNHGDVDPEAPAVVYWFKLVRGAKGQVDFIPYLIDDNSGVGTQVMAGNIQNKKFPDVVVGNKKGTFVFLHDTKKVSKAEWEKAQPKRVTTSADSKQATAK